MEVRIRGAGKLRERCSYWWRQSGALRPTFAAEAGRRVARVGGGESLDQKVWNTGGSALEGLKAAWQQKSLTNVSQYALPSVKSHSHDSVDFLQPRLALQVQQPSKWTVGSAPARELARPEPLKVKGWGKEIPTWAMLGIQTCPVISSSQQPCKGGIRIFAFPRRKQGSES